jgi:hypothetical protein
MQTLARGVWQLSGFPRNSVNVYLLEDVPIDAATHWTKPRILRQCRSPAPVELRLNTGQENRMKILDKQITGSNLTL